MKALLVHPNSRESPFKNILFVFFLCYGRQQLCTAISADTPVGQPPFHKLNSPIIVIVDTSSLLQSILLLGKDIEYFFIEHCPCATYIDCGLKNNFLKMENVFIKYRDHIYISFL
jgi:hypothetical protein